tara:strand:+ start:334 stop:468 length:135 start_codon:yes stop_codon:yes gene_type:complete
MSLIRMMNLEFKVLDLYAITGSWKSIERSGDQSADRGGMRLFGQ